MFRTTARLALLVLGAGCASEAEGDGRRPFREDRAPCTNRTETRMPLFGDLHVHTSYSFDAYIYDVRVDPAEAYAFAQGESVALPPLDSSGRGTTELRLERPLDFASVTDHAEFLGEVATCTRPGTPGYDLQRCQAYRRGDQNDFTEWGAQLTRQDPRRLRFCEEMGVDCGSEATDAWQRIQDEAERAYDRTEACSFTSLVGYEWTGAKSGRNDHRNVVFRSSRVPEVPTSYFEASTPQELWNALEATCLDAGTGCDVLAIPHNSNLANGGLFAPIYPGAQTLGEEADQARQRRDLEPLVEIFQHKGNSECNNGLSGVFGAPDELCLEEQLRPPPFDDCGDDLGVLGIQGVGCISRNDYVRTALLTGLKEKTRLGVNPFKTGIIASTDTHNGIAGATAEDAYVGHAGNLEDTVDRRLAPVALVPYGIDGNPGGLAGVWAEENTRDAIFDALKRRETWGTSGTRIVPRFFGGFELQDELCADAELAARGYQTGVPMGGTLSARSSGRPKFVVAAERDPASSANNLERLEIVKGYIDDAGEARYEVFVVAESAAGRVDLQTCRAPDGGAGSLCGIFEDETYDPGQEAYYYARIVEVESCRWSWRQCLELDEADRPEDCATARRTVHELAWTSPIWLSP